MEKREIDRDKHIEHESSLKKLRVYSSVILESIIQSNLLASTPRDILFKILLLLPFDDLINISKTTKDLNYLLRDHSFWVNVILGDFGLSHPLNINAVHDDVLLLKEIINGQKSVESVFTEDIINAYDNGTYLIAKSKLLAIIENFKRESLSSLYYECILKSLNNEHFVLTAFNPKPEGSLKEIPKRKTKVFSLLISNGGFLGCSVDEWNKLGKIELSVQLCKGKDRVYFKDYPHGELASFSNALSACKLYPQKNGKLKLKHIPKSKYNVRVLTDENDLTGQKRDFTQSPGFYALYKDFQYRIVVFSISYESPSEGEKIDLTFKKEDLTLLYDTGDLNLKNKEFFLSVKSVALEENDEPLKIVTMGHESDGINNTYITFEHEAEKGLFKFMVPKIALDSWGYGVPLVYTKSVTLKIPKDEIKLESNFFSPNKRMYLYEKAYRDDQMKLSKSLSKPGVLSKGENDTTSTTNIQSIVKIGLSIESKRELIFVKEGDGSSTLMDKNSSKLYCNHKLNHSVHKDYLQNHKKGDYNACPVCGIEEELKKYKM